MCFPLACIYLIVSNLLVFFFFFTLLCHLISLVLITLGHIRFFLKPKWPLNIQYFAKEDVSLQKEHALR